MKDNLSLFETIVLVGGLIVFLVLLGLVGGIQ